MFYTIIPSPVGEITLSSDGKALTSLHIEGDKYFTAIPHDWIRNNDDPILQKAKVQLDEYFAKERTTFDLPLSLDGTVFQKAVWKALQSIPSGDTVSYMHIAKEIGKAEAIRAVGTAIGKNPICIIVPCHRVVGSNGSVTGYVAGVKVKQFLLNLENKALPLGI